MKKPIEHLIDRVEMLSFFNQRSGRELWSSKPIDIQNKDIDNAEKTYQELLDFLKDSYKYRWHDLINNPNDLPEKIGEEYIVQCTDGIGFAIYGYRGWVDLVDENVISESVIAWKEIDLEPFEDEYLGEEE